jgi:ribosomal-protein-alanine N-acetyltransferase
MDFVIRDMSIEDVDQVCSIEEETFSMPWGRESFIKMVSNPDALYMVAVSEEEDGKSKVLGCIGILNICGEGNICNVVVKEEYRGNHIASALMDEMLKRRRGMGIEMFTLEVRESNEPAIKLYSKYGFESVGYRPGYYEKPTEDALIMNKVVF